MKSAAFARAGALVACALALTGCLEPDLPADYGDPTNLAVATTAGGITARVFSPSSSGTLGEPTAHVELAAFTDPPVALDVYVTTPEGFAFTATATGAPGPDQRFVVDVPLLHGQNLLLVRIAEVDGLRTRRIELAATYEGSAPALRYGLYDDRDGAPCGTSLEPSITASPAVCVRGRATTSDEPLVSALAGLAGTAGVAVTIDAEGGFETLVDLPADATSEVFVTGFGGDGSERTVRRDVIQDSTPPALTAPLAEASPTRTAELGLLVTGTVSDEHGVRELRLENDAGGVVSLTPSATFERNVQLVPGENAFELVALDVAGNESRLAFIVIRDRLIRLRPEGSPGQALLSLDRAALGQVLTEQVQKDTEIVQVSLRTAVLESLHRIRDPESFGVDTSTWGPAEWNLNSLLNMTPDTANLTGSSIEELLAIAPSVSLPSPRLLADLLGLEPTDPFIDLDVVTDVVLEQLVRSHPAFAGTTGDPLLSLSMYDVLNDLAPLEGRFGPSGAHPGFLDGGISSQVFEPGFLMSIPASSNLSPYEGVDASRGAKEYFFVLEGGEVLVLDFLSNDFSVVGLVDEPTVDMRFTLGESALSFGVSTDQYADPDGEFYRGNSGVFAANPWELEHIVAESAYRQYHPLFAAQSYMNTLSYDAGAIVDAATIAWDRGWVTIETSGDIGNPPAPTYVWDILTEVAQLRLHENIADQVSLAFPLEDLPIGLDAAGLIEALRPTLQSQAAELASSLVSADGLVASGADFYFVAATDGGPGFLFFRAVGDASGPYSYSNPGFYGDAALATKTSSTGALAGTGDATHEKVVPVAGAHHFFADDTGVVYDLEIVLVDADGVAVRVTPVMETVP